MDVIIKYKAGETVRLSDCTVTVKQDCKEDVFGNLTVPIGKQYLTVEVPMNDWDKGAHYGTWDNSNYYSDYTYKYIDASKWNRGKSEDTPIVFRGILEDITTGHKNEERRDKMISRRVFNEALAEAGVSKGVRRKVEKLSDNDFEYLIASMLAKMFDSEMLKVFEPDIQKVKVVEEA